MSSITPLLDTLVHQIAKQSSTVDLLPRRTLPVTPIQATTSTTEFSQAGQQIARLFQLIESLQQHITLNPGGMQRAGGYVKNTGGVFPTTVQLDALTIANRLKAIVINSGLFYESLLARWAVQKIPFSTVRQQPQNLGQFQINSSQIQSILGQQLELLHTGVIYIDTELWPQAHLQWLIQPDVNPLIQRWRDDQRRQKGDESTDSGWVSELKLSLPVVGEIRAKIRLSEKRLNLQLQCHESLVNSLRSIAPRLAGRLRRDVGVEINDIPVSRLPE